MSEQTICPHTDGILEREHCTLCIEGPTPPEKKKVRPHRPKPAISPMDMLVAEYATGNRCMICDTLKDDRGQCAHQRADIFEANADEIRAFVAEHYDPDDDRHTRWVLGLGSSAVKRASLRAGLSNTPTNIAGTSVGQVLSMGERRRAGRPLEWQRFRPSGDPMPA